MIKMIMSAGRSAVATASAVLSARVYAAMRYVENSLSSLRSTLDNYAFRLLKTCCTLARGVVNSARMTRSKSVVAGTNRMKVCRTLCSPMPKD